MSEDNEYNGGPVNGRIPKHLRRTTGWKPVFFSTRPAAVSYQNDSENWREVDHSGRQPYFHGPIHVKTAEIAEYLSHTTGVPFFQVARPGNERAKTMMRIMNLTEEERHAEIEGVLAEDYQHDHAISFDPKKLERMGDQIPQYHWFRRDAV